jgi:transposase
LGVKLFRPYDLDQTYLLPLDLRSWLPEGHLALFVSDVVEQLDLGPIYAQYERGDGRGQPPYEPQMLVKLLVYGYCTGLVSSRRIEKATWEDVPFRVLAANQHPDHDTIAAFRQRHLGALRGLFLQVLRMCQEAGLVKLGHVAIDGTKVKANASKHKAMSYRRMVETEEKLKKQIDEMLAEAQRVDEAEDAKFGKGKRGDELPEELRRRESRLKKIQEAKAALEAEAREKAEMEAEEARTKLAEREEKEAKAGRKLPGRRPQVPDPKEAKPEPKAQKNFTDPESRIMPDKGGFSQAYNAQIAVDAEAQIIVATGVTQQTNDKQQLPVMLEKVKGNLEKLPEKTSGDAGYFSEEALTDERCSGTDLYVPPNRVPHGQAASSKTPAVTPQQGSASCEMRKKLDSPEGKAVYARRKAIVEPVFGQIKGARGLRGFSFRGLAQVAAEWDIICWTHNLLKLFRSGASLKVTQQTKATRTGNREQATENREFEITQRGSILQSLFPVPCCLFPVPVSPTRT